MSLTEKVLKTIMQLNAVAKELSKMPVFRLEAFTVEEVKSAVEMISID